MDADSGRDSVAPEKLIRALLLQVFYSIRSERPLCEQLRYNLLFRWFVGLALDAPICDLLDLLEESLLVAGASGGGRPVCRGHAPGRCPWPAVEGTFLGRRHADSGVGEPERSFDRRTGSDDQRPGGGGRNAQADWKGQPRTNDTHASTTDPDVRNLPQEPPHGVDPLLPRPCADGESQRSGGERRGHACGWFRGTPRGTGHVLDAVPDPGHRSVGADKAYDTTDFVAACRQRRSPHTSPATIPAVAVARSTGAPPVIPVTA